MSDHTTEVVLNCLGKYNVTQDYREYFVDNKDPNWVQVPRQLLVSLASPLTCGINSSRLGR